MRREKEIVDYANKLNEEEKARQRQKVQDMK